MRCVICFVVITVFTATFQPLVAVAFICSIINTKLNDISSDKYSGLFDVSVLKLESK